MADSAVGLDVLPLEISWSLPYKFEEEKWEKESWRRKKEPFLSSILPPPLQILFRYIVNSMNLKRWNDLYWCYISERRQYTLWRVSSSQLIVGANCYGSGPFSSCTLGELWAYVRGGWPPGLARCRGIAETERKGLHMRRINALIVLFAYIFNMAST